MLAPALFLASMGLTAIFAALLWRETMGGRVEQDRGEGEIAARHFALIRTALFEPEGRLAVLAAAISLVIVCLH
jgi:hypothetical protein